tara:strand:+ start:59 stop:568 length:510 start_codon:yes stop_codon:yes gene_type:complete
MESFVVFIIFGLLAWHIVRTIRQNIKRGLKRRWDKEDNLNIDGIEGGKRYANYFIKSYPKFPNEKNSKEWADKVIFLNFITRLLLDSKHLDIDFGSNIEEMTIKGDFDQLDPMSLQALTTIDQLNKEETAKAYFIAWEIIRNFLENKEITFNRKTTINELKEQMLKYDY